VNAQAMPAIKGLRLPALLAGLADGVPDIAISHLSQDSRTLREGSLFAALRGEVHDGRDFLPAAAAAGAVAALVEELPAGGVPGLPLVVVPQLKQHLGEIASRFYGHPSASMHVAAVTGTNGKTTVSQMLAQLIRSGGYACGALGTLGASLDFGPVAATHTTPDAITLQASLAEWAGQAVPFVAMEASSHALDQGRMHGVQVDTAIFTNLTRDHLDYHGDMAAYGRAKAQLFSLPGLRRAILNGDDPFAAELAALLAPEVEVLRYSLTRGDAELRLTELSLDHRGMRARLHSPWGQATLRSPLLGRFNASNLLAALGAALAAGLPLDDLVRAAAALRPVPGRMEPLRQPGAPLVVIDYAHTPDALAQVLAALRPQTAGRLIIVFGCGGNRDRGKRAEMARAASRGADYCVVTSDNPRREDPAAIIADIEAAMEGDYRAVADRAAAIESAIALADSGDCVLIAGKGHEDYQIVGEERLPFSDMAQARHSLEARVL
jgi:UDP-N-acetylmuramoyl-L-alanyl-D-glutamate--2,6-diaminopimelate ligase